jgi:peptidoglycan/xylan/chitin deacetylase (PgdA/CDA1 family)
MSRRMLLGLGLAVGASIAGCTRAGRTPAATGPATGQPRATTATAATAARSGAATGSGSNAGATPGTASTSATTAAHAAPPGGPAIEVATGPASRREVALTFHGAGDPAIARQLLDILARSGAAVTVLAVGSWLQANPALARAIVAGGHELGNHTYNHLDIDSLPPAQAQAEIVRCRDLLRTLVGSGGEHFRPSQTQHASAEVLALAGAAGYRTCLSYSVDSLDYTDPGADAVRANVAQAGPGAIVSMHFGHPGTVTALPGILADLAARGLRPVTAARLLQP